MNVEIKNIFLNSIKSVNPGRLVKSVLNFDSNYLIINNELKFFVNNNCYLVGFGKAVYDMAMEVENVLGKHLQKGIISVPYGSTKKSSNYLNENSVVHVVEGGKNNLPDKNSFKASIAIKKLAMKCQKNDLLLVLITGGGSALLSHPVFPITLEEKIKVIKLIASAGANIVELNSVRMALSELKGGKLAKLAYPATVIALILSDIVGDPVKFIASGPTVLPNKSSPMDALMILKKYNLMETVDGSIKTFLNTHFDKKDQTIESCCSEENSNFPHNIIIGNNLNFLKTAKKEAEVLGYSSIILTNQIDGSIHQLADEYFKIIEYVCSYLDSGEEKIFLDRMNQLRKLCGKQRYVDAMIENMTADIRIINECYESKKSLCLIAGGEPTVRITGNGLGGRNQELTLRIAFEFQKLLLKHATWINKFDLFFSSIGTDGIDGPTDAAGAIAYRHLIKDASVCHLNPTAYLDNNDSYTFFSLFNKGSQLIKTGHTGTNVMDVHFIFICYCA